MKRIICFLLGHKWKDIVHGNLLHLKECTRCKENLIGFGIDL